MIGSPYAADIDAEERSWYELASLVRSLTPGERLEPGYYRDPDWSVRDLVGHLGTWLAEAATQFDRMVAGTYTGHDDVDIDALNAQFLAAMVGQPWDVVWSQANAGRTVMLQAWTRITTPNDEAAWWIRKSAVDHYADHLGRLRVWVEELVARRTRRSGAASGSARGALMPRRVHRRPVVRGRADAERGRARSSSSNSA